MSYCTAYALALIFRRLTNAASNLRRSEELVLFRDWVRQLMCDPAAYLPEVCVDALLLTLLVSTLMGATTTSHTPVVLVPDVDQIWSAGCLEVAGLA